MCVCVFKINVLFFHYNFFMFNNFKDIKIWKFYPNFELDFDIDIDASLSFLINSTTNPRWKQQKDTKLGYVL
jgi:hypothetical protein